MSEVVSKYDFKCTGFFKYEKGHWLFSEKCQWTTNANAGKLKDAAIKLKESKISDKGTLDILTLDILINRLNRTSKLHINNNHQEEGLFFWLTSNASFHKIERAQAICLKHFVEHILSNPSHANTNDYLIVANIVGQCVTVQIGTSAATPSHSWFFLSSRGEEDFISEFFRDYVLAFPKLFFKDPDNFELKSDDELSKVADLLKSHRVLYNTKVEVIDKNNESLKITIESTLMEYPKGRICGCIPIPGKLIDRPGEEPATVKTPEVVITSPNVVEALLSLSQVWQDKFAKSILISAPPGSGKEQFSQSIAYSSGCEVNPLSFAEGEKDQLEKVLFGQVGQSGEIKPGLISKSEDKVLFLDEVHHPEDDAGIRGSLLRVLESDQFTPVGSDKPIDINNVLFVLATSKPLKGKGKKARGLNEIPPIDFWTRMTHVITIKHPFESVWGSSFPNILDSYFSFFWWDRLEKYFKIDPRTEDNLKKIKITSNFGFKEKWVGNKDTDLDYKQRLAQMKELRDLPNIDGNLKKLAEVFRERFTTILKEERIQPHEISIRGLKNIVTRIFSISTTAVTQGSSFNNTFLNELEKKMDPIIYEILEIATLDD